MQNEIPVIALVRRPETREAEIERALAPGPYPESRRRHCLPDMEAVARVFSRANLDLLARLRPLGHVSLDDAASALGYADARAFVMRTMDGLNLFLSFRPLDDDRPGVLVDFAFLLIDLDIRVSGE